MQDAFFDVRHNLERVRTVHFAHSRAMARADLMRATDGELTRLGASLAELGTPWSEFARAEAIRRERLCR